MKYYLLICLAFFMNTFLSAQNIYSHIPSKIDTSKKYIFYLHGAIIENKGIRPVSERYGPYEYEEILKTLAGNEIVVISEARPKNTNG